MHMCSILAQSFEDRGEWEGGKEEGREGEEGGKGGGSEVRRGAQA